MKDIIPGPLHMTHCQSFSPLRVAVCQCLEDLLMLASRFLSTVLVADRQLPVAYQPFMEIGQLLSNIRLPQAA